METYKTYITIENPDRVVLSNLPFQVGQRVEIIVLPEYNRAAISQKLKALFKKTQALPEVSEITDADIEAEINGIIVGCLYLPNGNPAPGPKFDYKLRWFERLTVHAAELIASKKPVVLTGDYNVMPTEKDVYKPERWVKDALFRPEVREAFSKFKTQGWTDAIRKLYPDDTIYTFWDYFRNAYGRNAGLRIDHFLLSPAISKRLIDAGVDREVRGWEKTSDHAPVWIKIK